MEISLFGVAPRPQGIVSDRRVAPRLPQQVRVVITVEGQKTPLGGWVVDRSLGGLRLSLAEPLEVGKVLKVRPSSVAPKYWLQVEVKYCRECDGHYEAGCEFVGTPSFNVLAMFR